MLPLGTELFFISPSAPCISSETSVHDPASRESKSVSSAAGTGVACAGWEFDAQQLPQQVHAEASPLQVHLDAAAGADAVAPQAHSEVRVPISDMASFISDHALKASGKTALTVVLTPETLGKITVRMVNESGKLTVEILTETAEAKQLLQAKSEQLAYALRNDNVELTSYKVETSQTELFQRDFDGSSKNPYRQQSQKDNNNESDEFDSLLGEIQAMD